MTGLEPQENVVCPFTVLERELVPELLIDVPPGVTLRRQNPEDARGTTDGEALCGDGAAWPDAPGRDVGSPAMLVVQPATTSIGSVTATSTEPSTRWRVRRSFTVRIVPLIRVAWRALCDDRPCACRDQAFPLGNRPAG
ncbi:hypothetical protein GCM10009608_75720 [Pseudonocardia alaniniphila]